MEAIKYNLSEKLKDSLIDIISENSIVSITDAMGRIEYVNDNFCNLLEYNESQLLGETLKLLKSPLHIELVYKNLWKTIELGHKWNGKLNTETQSGKPIRLDTTIVPIKRDNNVMYVIIYKDITQQYNKIVTLLESNKRSNMFLENMPFQIFSISKFGKIINANKSFCNKEIVDIIDTYIYDFIKPRYYEDFKDLIDAVFKKKISKQLEFFDLDTNGEKSFNSFRVFPVLNELGLAVSATICIHEIIDETTEETTEETTDETTDETTGKTVSNDALEDVFADFSITN